MLRKFAIPAMLLMGLGCAIGGCDAGKQPAGKAAKTSAAAADDETAGLKLLDEADRKLAEKQKVCPVSGSPLGSMDKPYKMTVKGHVFFLCCEHCKSTVEKDPDGTIKKVEALIAGK